MTPSLDVLGANGQRNEKKGKDERNDKNDGLHDGAYGLSAYGGMEFRRGVWRAPGSLALNFPCGVFPFLLFLRRVCSEFLATLEEGLLEMNVIVVLSDCPCFFLLFFLALIFGQLLKTEIVAKSGGVYHGEGKEWDRELTKNGKGMRGVGVVVGIIVGGGGKGGRDVRGSKKVE